MIIIITKRALGIILFSKAHNLKVQSNKMHIMYITNKYLIKCRNYKWEEYIPRSLNCWGSYDFMKSNSDWYGRVGGGIEGRGGDSWVTE